MKLFKSILFFTFILFIMTTFSQCAGTQNFQSNAPFDMGEVYYQPWISGVQGGGSGINLVIPIVSNPKNIILDSVHFHGKQAKLEFRNNKIYIGRFQTEINQKADVIMSNEPYAEYGNKVPVIPKKTPFKLQENECIVSYEINGEIKYFKIHNITKIDLLELMSSPPNKE